MAIVKFKIRESKEGFQVDLTAKQLDIEAEGFLPPLPEKLQSSFNNWQLAYRQNDDVRSVFTSRQVRLSPKAITKYSSSEYTNSVKECLNQWLNSGDGRWLPVRDRLIAIAQQLHQTKSEIRIIIDAKDVNLRRLPWQEWNLFEEHYPQVEIALIAGKNKYTNYVLPKSSKIRVLVAVGRSDGINTKDDLEVIKELEQHGAEVVCLMQPSRKDLCKALWDDQGYHIFIFTGHSGSGEDGSIGWIELNDNDSLSIEEFKEALKQAISQGLQLAIFNSCDGLGLASQLAQLHLPRCIVMREPVPDKVAVEFLEYFFAEFTRNQSLSKALNRARKQLEHFNLDYPGAIWLPTICIAANAKPLTWKSLNPGNSTPGKLDEKPDDSKIQNKRNIKPLILTGLIGLVISGITVWTLNQISKPAQEAPIQSTQKKSTFSSITVPSGTFRYGGSTTWAPLRDKVEKVLEKVHSEFKLKYTDSKTQNPGSGTGIQMLLNGELDFSQSSRNFTTEEEKYAEKKGFVLKKIPIAIDAIAVVVNHSLPNNELTLSQLEEIYIGKIKNWKDLGGPDLAIKPYSRNKEPGGTVEYFIEDVLTGKEFGSNVEKVPNTTQGIRQVAANEGGIYYGSASEVVNQCSVKSLKLGKTRTNTIAPYKEPLIPYPDCNKKSNQVNLDKLSSHEYPVTRPLYVIYKQTNSSIEPDLRQESIGKKAAKAYVKLLKTDEGKELIKEAGFVPIN